MPHDVPFYPWLQHATDYVGCWVVYDFEKVVFHSRKVREVRRFLIEKADDNLGVWHIPRARRNTVALGL